MTATYIRHRLRLLRSSNSHVDLAKHQTTLYLAHDVQDIETTSNHCPAVSSAIVIMWNDEDNNPYAAFEDRQASPLGEPNPVLNPDRLSYPEAESKHQTYHSDRLQRDVSATIFT